MSLNLSRLGTKPVHVACYCDASSANIHDHNTQLCHIFFLCDADRNSLQIHYKSFKSKRVFSSAMAGEVIAFSDLFDVASAMAAELAFVIKRKNRVQLLPESTRPFDAFGKRLVLPKSGECWTSPRLKKSSVKTSSLTPFSSGAGRT